MTNQSFATPALPSYTFLPPPAPLREFMANVAKYFIKVTPTHNLLLRMYYVSNFIKVGNTWTARGLVKIV